MAQRNTLFLLLAALFISLFCARANCSDEVDYNDELPEIVAKTALYACKADPEISTNKKSLKKCAALYDAMLILMEHMEGQNDYSVFSVDEATVKLALKKPKIETQIKNFINQQVTFIRENSAMVSTDWIVTNFKPQWDGIKHAIFTDHYNIPEPEPINLSSPATTEGAGQPEVQMELEETKDEL